MLKEEKLTQLSDIQSTIQDLIIAGVRILTETEGKDEVEASNFVTALAKMHLASITGSVFMMRSQSNSKVSLAEDVNTFIGELHNSHKRLMKEGAFK